MVVSGAIICGLTMPEIGSALKVTKSGQIVREIRDKNGNGVYNPFKLAEIKQNNGDYKQKKEMKPGIRFF